MSAGRNPDRPRLRGQQQQQRKYFHGGRDHTVEYLVMRLRVALLGFAFLTLARSAYADGEATFNNQVVRVFQQHCQTCHRPGEVAPFSLVAYRDAYPRRDDIRDVVRSRYMPPWKAVPGHGEFADVRRLSEAQIELIARWVADGAPEGDP